MYFFFDLLFCVLILVRAVCVVVVTIIRRPSDCLSGSLTCRTSCVCTCPTDCPFKISSYKFVPRIYLVLSSVNTHPMGRCTVKAWNETRNRPDDDDSTSHSLLLTSSLDKTGGRFPGVADESKTHSPVSHNNSLDNKNTSEEVKS